jgi:hypothetical protein
MNLDELTGAAPAADSVRCVIGRIIDSLPDTHQSTFAAICETYAADGGEALDVVFARIRRAGITTGSVRTLGMHRKKRCSCYWNEETHA